MPYFARTYGPFLDLASVFVLAAAGAAVSKEGGGCESCRCRVTIEKGDVSSRLDRLAYLSTMGSSGARASEYAVDSERRLRRPQIEAHSDAVSPFFRLPACLQTFDITLLCNQFLF